MMGFRFLALAAAIAAVGLPNQGGARDVKKDSASYILAQKPRCLFRYDEKLETRVLSVLQHELSSSGARFYDASRPIVTVCRSKATLMFSGTKRDNGHELLDPSNIFIDVDVCSHRILTIDHDNGTTVVDTPPCE
jgi:hypothetical protein